MKFILEQSNFPAVPSQTERLQERHTIGQPLDIECCGLPIQVLSGVYRTSVDTELMAESVCLEPGQTFLEIGCGTGTVCLYLAQYAKSGVGVDLNERAVENSKLNAEKNGISNIQFLQSDVFENVTGTFDAVICNPPYNNHGAKDAIDKMFWDPNNLMKQKFFNQADRYLNPGGRIYFGWANFADLSIYLPFRLAENNGFEIVEVYKKPAHNKSFMFYVFEFKRKSG